MTPLMKINMRIISRLPCTIVEATRVIGQKISRIESAPAYRVMTTTKTNGINVIQAYRAFPMLTRKVDATERAIVASN